MQSALMQSWYVGLQNHISDFSNTASFFIYSILITKWEGIILPDVIANNVNILQTKTETNNLRQFLETEHWSQSLPSSRAIRWNAREMELEN